MTKTEDKELEKIIERYYLGMWQGGFLQIPNQMKAKRQLRNLGKECRDYGRTREKSTTWIVCDEAKPMPTKREMDILCSKVMELTIQKPSLWQRIKSAFSRGFTK